MLVDGIRVLAQSDVIETPFWVFLIIVFSLFAGIGMVVVGTSEFGSGLCSKRGKIITGIGIGLCLVFLAMFGLSIGNVFDKDTSLNKYKCVIEDGVSIKDVYDRYDVVSVEGDLWILKDKAG